jgi:glutathione S-transferase
MSMDLYVFPPSPNSRKVLVVAQHLGLRPELRIVDLRKGEQLKEELVRLNPNHKVPTLVDDGFVVWESTAIMQYLASGKPESGLWPTERRAQTDVLRWLSWQLAHFGPACGILTFENVAKALLGIGEPDPKEIARGEEEFHRFAKVLDGHLAGREYLVGDALTLADISVAVWLTYAGPARFPLEGYGEIRRWSAALERLDAFVRTAPQGLAS